MLNQTVIVGRIVNDPVLEKNNGKSKSEIILAVNRNYKNEEGLYATDLIPVTLWNSIAENVMGYCDKGDLVGIKGRLKTEDEKLVIVAEKVTFLSTKKED